MAAYTRYSVFRKFIFSNFNIKSFQTLDRRKKFFKMFRCKTESAICLQQTREFHATNVHSKRRKTAEERKSVRIIEYTKSKAEIMDVWSGITPRELAQMYNRDIQYIYDIFLNEFRNPDVPITDMKLLLLAIKRSGRRMRIIAKPVDKVEDTEDKDVHPRPPPAKSELKPRPPVVTVMGHVDHGKTTLLDALRNSSVVEQEFGGITQHIGAFSVTLKSGSQITFLDTPGHAAFSSMRARGANLTDIVVLVVAADDGVMEQTLESIKMAQRANVPILIAINKIDAPKADIERTERMLLEIGIQTERQGGEVQAVPISALKKQNLDQLMEAIFAQAELCEIGGDPTGHVEAVVVESKVEQHRGRLCTVVVQRGTLKRGNILVADTAMARVRTLRNAEGQSLETAGPGYPAEIEGWKELPPAGEVVLQVESEKKGRDVIRFRKSRKEMEKLSEDAKVISEKEEQHNTVYQEQLKKKRLMGRFKLKREGPRKPEIERDDSGPPRLNIILKTDVDGTLEAILDVLSTYHSEKCKMDVIHFGVGAVTENDIELAQTFNSIIYTFNVQLPQNLKNLAEESKVEVKHHNVIYKLMDEVKDEINKRLPLREVEEVLGEAVVQQQFDITQGKKKIPTAGCRCEKGILKKRALVKLVRNGEILFTGALSSMRHLKNEVEVIKFDTECGIQLSDNSVQFEKGDTIICFEKKQIEQKTDWDPGF